MSKQGHSQEQIDRKLVSIGRWNEKELEHYRNIQEYNDKIRTTFSSDTTKRLQRQINIAQNNIEICKLQRIILENELLVDKLRKDNYKIKTQHDNEVTI